jgi:hypothetical protein
MKRVNAGSELAKKRWKKTTKEQRQAVAKRLNEARRKKRENNG